MLIVLILELRNTMNKQIIKFGFALIAFFTLLILVITGEASVIDQSGFHLFHGTLFSPVTAWMLGVTDVSEPAIWAVILNVIILYTFFIKKHGQKAIYWAMVIDGGVILASLIKVIIGRTRPLHQLIHDTGYSFPSIHTMMAAMVIYLLLTSIKRKDLKYRIAQILGLLWVIIVAISRVYLRNHFPTDVMAGALLAYIWGTIVRIWFIKLKWI